MKRAILFDFDQTLVDFSPAAGSRSVIAGSRADARLFHDGASRCYAFLSAHERSLPNFEGFLRQQRWSRRRCDWTTRLTGGEPDLRRFLRRICKDYGLQRDQASLATLGWQWYEPLTAHATVAPDVIPILSALCKAGLELGLVVNSAYPGAVIDQHLEALDLLEFFPARAYSTDIGARKPDPRPFTAALEAMNVTAAETIYVGNDLKTGILGANRLGLTTVLRSHTRTNAAADHVIQQLTELLDLPELEHVRTHAKSKPPAIPALIT